MAETHVYLREQIAKARDSYVASPSERKALYLFLKLNEQWKRPSVAVKLGQEKYRWLEGLVEYGDKHDWYLDAARQAANKEAKVK